MNIKLRAHRTQGPGRSKNHKENCCREKYPEGSRTHRNALLRCPVPTMSVFEVQLNKCTTNSLNHVGRSCGGDLKQKQVFSPENSVMNH